MKLTTEPGALAGAVRFAARVLTARTAYPVLSGLKITAGPDGAMEVSASGHETSARARTAAEVSEPGTVLAPGRLLAEIAAVLPRQPAELADDGPARAARRGRARRRCRVRRRGPPGGDRRIPRRHPARARRRPGHLRRRRADADGDRPVPGRAAPPAMAARRHRAAAARAGPAAALTDAARADAGDPAGVHLLTGPDGAPAAAGFASGGQAITIRLASGDYPDITKLILAGLSATAVIDVGELADTVKRLAVVAARDTPVRLAIGPGQVTLTAGSGEQADGTDTVACELDGGPITVAFHPRRLLDALTGTGRARIALATPARPALFTPAGGGQDDDAGPGYRHLLMPIRTAS